MTIVIEGYSVLIDYEDSKRILARKWRLNHNGHGQVYFSTGGPKDSIRLHRFILGLSKGDGKVVDHKNGNTLDNKKSNLRICSPSQNLQNMKTPKHNKSGLKGASWEKKSKKWGAWIQISGKTRWLGHYETPQEAHEAYCSAARKCFGEFARTE
jgi:hypothetical protein